MSGSIVKIAIALNEAAAHNIVFVISSSQAKLIQPFGMPKSALVVISNCLDKFPVPFLAPEIASFIL